MRSLCLMFLFLALSLCSCSLISGGGAEPGGISSQTSASLPEAAREDYEKALKLWSAGDVSADPQASLTLLGAVLLKAPSYAPAYRMRGLVYSQLGEKENAFEDLTKAVRLDPGPDMYAARALVSLRANLLTASMRDVDYALSKDSDSAKAFSVRGRIRQKEGNIKDACEDLQKARSLGDAFALEEAGKICGK